MSTYFEDIIRLKSEHLADLKKTTAEVEREISDAQDSLQREFARATAGQAAEPGYDAEACQCEQCQPRQARVPSPRRPAYTAPRLDFDFAPGQAEPGESGRYDVGRYEADLASAPDAVEADPDAERTTILINKGRPSAHRPKLAVSRRLVIAAIAGVTLLVVLILLVTSGGGASWPASVAQVQGWMEQEIGRAHV